MATQQEQPKQPEPRAGQPEEDELAKKQEELADTVRKHFARLRGEGAE